METPSPYTHFGQKGIGEGGAIAPPAAIANAVNDALRPLGVELMQSPITPRRIVEAILAARDAEEAGGMKPAPFDYERPRDLQAALAAARRRPNAPPRSSPAASRLGRCSTCAWRSRS